MKRIVIVLIGIAVVAAIATFAWLGRDKRASDTADPSTTRGDEQFEFGTPKKSAHFESNTPAHGQTLAAVPVDIVIDFNFDLAQGSKITINKDGQDYSSGELVIDDNKLAMRQSMDQLAPDGMYQVDYLACWPDGSCHDGHFSFGLDRSLADGYEDRRDQSEVTVRMSQIKFAPMNLRISNGTKVTWINDDNVDHYVNTDSHPAHTQVLSLNSRALPPGGSFSYVFSKSGAYPYHCSAHAASMTASIIIE